LVKRADSEAAAPVVEPTPVVFEPDRPAAEVQAPPAVAPEPPPEIAVTPAVPPQPPAVPEITPSRMAPGRPARLKKAVEEAKPAKLSAQPAVPKAEKSGTVEAETRERKFVARAKESEAQPDVPQATATPAASTAQQPASDKLTAIQSGRKKLRGIRINPDLE
jgi:hypothetical protein